jgi:hypothetical protein
MLDQQKIDAADKVTIGGLLRRIEAARNFPVNTDPAGRHVQIMGEALATGHPYPMLDEERGHCAISLLCVVAGLYEARARIATLERAAKAALSVVEAPSLTDSSEFLEAEIELRAALATLEGGK